MPVHRRVVQSASVDRLQALIAERLKPDADKTAIDRRIDDLFGETWCIMATDLCGFSRGVADFGIIHFLQTIYESSRILVPVVERNDGILLKIEGDSFLVIYRNVQKAIRSAIEMQRTVREYNAARESTEQVLLGVGLGYGKVLRIGDEDVFGVEVNSAYILGEDTARAYEILATQAVRDAAEEIDGITFEEIAKIPPGAGKAYRVRYQ